MRKILTGFLLLLLLAQPAYGTVTSVTRLTDHVGSGQTSFTVGFGFLDEAHLLLTDYTGACGSATYTDLTLTTDYTIERTSAENGTATVPGTVATGHCLRIQRIVPFTQEIPFRTQGRFSPAAHENAFDKLTHGLQQLTTDVVQSADTAVAIQAHIVSADDHTAYARLAGRVGGQTLQGDTASGGNLVLQSTAHSTKGKVYLGANSYYDGNTDNLHLYDTLYVANDLSVTDDGWITGELYGSTLTDGDMTIESTSHATKGSIIIAAILTVDDDAAVQGVGINTAAVAGVDLTLNQEIMTPKVIGSAASGGDLTLESTSHGTKGDIILGTASAYEQDDDELGLGTLSPAYKLHVVGDGLFTTDLTVGGALVCDTTTLVVDDTNNRVGIGTATPSVTLDVVGDAAVSGTLTMATLSLTGDLMVGDDAWIEGEIYGGDGASEDLVLESTSHATKGKVIFDTTTLVVSEVLNRVGIGTASPGTTLHVVGDGHFTTDLTVDGTVYGTNTNTVGNSWVEGTIYGGAAGGANLDIISTSHATKGKVLFDTTTLVVDEVNNRVGVGTATPSTTLHVVGAATVTTDLAVGNDTTVAGDLWAEGTVYGGDGDGSELVLESTSHANKGTVVVDTTTLVVDEVNHRVGIGTAAPTKILHVGGDTLFSANMVVDTTTLVVDATNNRVGIGTATPSVTLDVVGDAAVSGTLTMATLSLTNDLLVGDDAWIEGELYGGDGPGDNLEIISTSDVTKGKVIFDTTTLVVDEVNNRVGVGTATPSTTLHVVGAATVTTDLAVGNDTTVAGDLWTEGTIYGGDGNGDDLILESTSDAGKSKVIIDGTTLVVDEVNHRVGIGTATPGWPVEITGNTFIVGDLYADATLYGSGTTAENLDLRPNSADATGYTTFSATCAYVAVVDAFYLGSIDPKYTGRLNVKDADNGDHAAHFHNDNDNLLAYGIRIDAGLDLPGAPAADIIWASLGDGDRTPVSIIRRTAAGAGLGAEFAAASDVRLKKNIGPTDVQGLEVINGLPVRQFDWKDGSGHIPIGYVAQEVEEVWPAMVSTNHETGYLWVGDSSLGPVLVKAVQELSAQVEALEEQVTELQECQL